MFQISIFAWYRTWPFLENTLGLSRVSIPGLLNVASARERKLTGDSSVSSPFEFYLVSCRTSWVLRWFTVTIRKSLHASHGQCPSDVVVKSIIRPRTLNLGHNQRYGLPMDDWKWDYKPLLSVKCSAGMHGIRWGDILHDSLSDQANSTIVAVVDKGLVVPLAWLSKPLFWRSFPLFSLSESVLLASFSTGSYG
jgi:hypothetical protein